MRRRHGLLLITPLFVVGACVGQTVGDAIDFPVAAVGPPNAVAGQPFACSESGGWAITLTQASLHVGAVYLNQSQPVSGGSAVPGVIGILAFLMLVTVGNRHFALRRGR